MPNGKLLDILNGPDAAVRDAAALTVLKKHKGGLSIKGLSERLDWSEKSTSEAIERLRAAGHNIKILPHGEAELSTIVEPGARPKIVHAVEDFRGNWVSIGACGDNHLCNRHSRVDVLNALYDIYAEEGITRVYNTGNWIDGEARFNRHELLVFGMDNQLDYLIENYPQRKGITTYFIAGDDHEGWYQQRECVEIGRYLELRARAAGREDLVYLDYIESTVRLATPGGEVEMLILHPGGGSSYALSYRGQKFVECVPLESEILTQSGWARHDQISVGQAVLGYNAMSGRCEWTTVTAINYGTGEVVDYRNDNYAVRCTREHRWAMEWDHRGRGNPPTVHPLMQPISEARDRTRIVQAAPGPEGPGFSVAEHVAWMDREGCEKAVMAMTSAQRKAFIFGMLQGEGTLVAQQCVNFSQRPGPVHNAFVLACFLEGIACGVAHKTTKKMNGEDKVCNRTTVLRKNRRMVSSMREVGSRVEDVWCPTTELGTWVMRQGEVVTITGNSLQGGQKPGLVLQGHYHKFNCGYPREVWVIDTGTTCDQSGFMRKKALQAMVGGCIIDIHRAPSGGINRLRTEFIPFYDLAHYSPIKRRKPKR